jgi:hypothetical protein
MNPVDDYQKRASECLQFAETAPSFDDRTMWRELALCWLRFCDHAERFRLNAANGSMRRPGGPP